MGRYRGDLDLGQFAHVVGESTVGIVKIASHGEAGNQTKFSAAQLGFVRDPSGILAASDFRALEGDLNTENGFTI